MKNVKEIIQGYLAENEYEGLYNEHGCGCTCADLMPYGSPGITCKPGFKIQGCKNCNCVGPKGARCENE
jgi:hypothetical protein